LKILNEYTSVNREFLTAFKIHEIKLFSSACSIEVLTLSVNGIQGPEIVFYHIFTQIEHIR